MTSTGTICAIATPPGAGGIGIIRVSGPAALEVTRGLIARVPEAPEPHRAYWADFVDRQGQLLDQGLFLFFASPRSYTGEDVVELQAHGSPRLLELIQRELLVDPRVRLAEPGEFTRQAFMNGRIDLERAEAVGALIDAASEGAVRAAAASLRGELGTRVSPIAAALLRLRTELEGILNFPDESEGAEHNLTSLMIDALDGLEELHRAAERGRLFRRVPKVVFYGPVNAGKSTLFNRLLGEDRALVDESPGTTRDALEARFQSGGMAIDLVDTAGLRDQGADRVEAMGMARTRRELKDASLAILLLPPGVAPANRDRWIADAGDVPVLVVEGKSDLSPRISDGGPQPFAVSGRTGAGAHALQQEIERRLGHGDSNAAVFATSERQWEALSTALSALRRGSAQLQGGTLELVAGEVTLAAEALESVAATEAPGAVLDAIFQRFCIGK